MKTIREKLATVPKMKKTTLGRLDDKGGTTTKIAHQLYRTAVVPLQSSKVSWRHQESFSFDQWDGLYALEKFAIMPEREACDPRGHTPFERCWDVTARQLPASHCPPASLPEDVLSHLTELVRSELASLPSNLAVWDKHSAPPYCGGIGGVSISRQVCMGTYLLSSQCGWSTRPASGGPPPQRRPRSSPPVPDDDCTLS